MVVLGVELIVNTGTVCILGTVSYRCVQFQLPGRSTRYQLPAPGTGTWYQGTGMVGYQAPYVQFQLPGIGRWFYTAVNCKLFFGFQQYTSYTSTNIRQYGIVESHQLLLQLLYSNPTVYWYADTGKYYIQYTDQEQCKQCTRMRKLGPPRFTWWF